MRTAYLLRKFDELSAAREGIDLVRGQGQETFRVTERLDERFTTLEERLDKKINTKFDEVIQALQNISDKNGKGGG